MTKHDSVLLQESVAALVTDPNGCYVDGTYGRGGHSQAILAQLDDQARLLVIDKDPQAIAHAEQGIGQDPRVTVCHGSFAELEQLVTEQGLAGQVSGVLLDLGVSSPQLDEAERGFSFSQDGPLDMRMNTEAGESAAEWLSHAGAEEIATVLKEYGEERFARRMARAIVERRDVEPITRTGQLAKIVADANPAWEKGKHPATRAFQAIRIYINRELEDLKVVLDAALDVLAVDGRLTVISFHSLEDRIVKRFMREQERGKPLPRYLPITEDQIQTRLKVLGKAQKPSAQEIEQNVRARSAVLRVAAKTG